MLAAHYRLDGPGKANNAVEVIRQAST